MPKVDDEPTVYPLLRELDKHYQHYCRESMKYAPRGGEIPIGGNDWMDNFFRAEAIRGLINALRAGKKEKVAIQEGKTVGEIAIQIWNGRREYQVRRWDGFLEDFLTGILKRCKDDVRYRKQVR